jgi:hypothetical protein
MMQCEQAVVVNRQLYMVMLPLHHDGQEQQQVPSHQRQRQQRHHHRAAFRRSSRLILAGIVATWAVALSTTTTTMRLLLPVVSASTSDLKALHATIADDNMGPPDTKESSSGTISTETKVHYGLDVSFPIHSKKVSENYAWLPHNADPANHPKPAEFLGVPIQSLGNRQQFYQEFVNSKYYQVQYL